MLDDAGPDEGVADQKNDAREAGKELGKMNVIEINAKCIEKKSGELFSLAFFSGRV